MIYARRAFCGRQSAGKNPFIFSSAYLSSSTVQSQYLLPIVLGSNSFNRSLYMTSHYQLYGKKYSQNNRHKINTHRRARRYAVRAWLDGIRSQLQCCRCDENHPSCLEFHHTNGDKEFQIGSSKTRDFTLERIKLEIEKCIVLCANCHKKEHYKERGLSPDNQVFSS